MFGHQRKGSPELCSSWADDEDAEWDWLVGEWLRWSGTFLRFVQALPLGPFHTTQCTYDGRHLYRKAEDTHQREPWKVCWVLVFRQDWNRGSSRLEGKCTRVDWQRRLLSILRDYVQNHGMFLYASSCRRVINWRFKVTALLIPVFLLALHSKHNIKLTNIKFIAISHLLWAIPNGFALQEVMNEGPLFLWLMTYSWTLAQLGTVSLVALGALRAGRGHRISTSPYMTRWRRYSTKNSIPCGIWGNNKCCWSRYLCVAVTRHFARWALGQGLFLCSCYLYLALRWLARDNCSLLSNERALWRTIQSLAMSLSPNCLIHCDEQEKMLKPRKDKKCQHPQKVDKGEGLFPQGRRCLRSRPLEMTRKKTPALNRWSPFWHCHGVPSCRSKPHGRRR